MNKKFLLALALPAVMVGCSQEDLVSEGVVATTPAGKAIDNVVFNIAKNADANGVESRAAWVNNKISFEKSDKVSLYWLGSDGKKQGSGVFDNDAQNPAATFSGVLPGLSNAVFRTEDGSAFTAEAVVYEGYNLLVYPANVKHTTAADVKVSLPAVQKAADDFAENAIYVGDSILHIHQPAKAANGKYYDIYGNEATTEDPNTSGYAHGVKTGVKLLTSLLHMDLRIVNAPANDVVIKKVILTTKEHLADNTKALKTFNQWGNLKAAADDVTPISHQIDPQFQATYQNPWFAANDEGKTSSVVLDFEGVTTNVNGSTKGTMLLLPTNINTDLVNADQPVLQVVTNYGTVRIGGNVAAEDNQIRAIYTTEGEGAAKNDNEALKDIVKYATSYKAKMKVYRKDAADKKQDYTFNSGVSMSRIISVDMAQAVMEGMEASTTEELNAILKAAVTNKNNKFTAGNASATPAVPAKKLQVKLIPNNKGEFTLTNYEGLDAFVKKFGTGALDLIAGSKRYGAEIKTTGTVVVNTTTVTELKNVDGLNENITLTIPATSAINSVKNGADANHYHVVENAIVNETTITLPKWSSVKLWDNEKGTFIYNLGAKFNANSKGGKAYGKIFYEADTWNNAELAAKNSANYILVDGEGKSFFAGAVDLLDPATFDADRMDRGGITVEFKDCGDLTETVEKGIETTTIVLSGNTTYTNMSKAKVTNVIVKSTNAKLGMGTTKDLNDDITKITIAEGTTEIDYIQAGTIEVKSGATATITKNSVAPTNFYVWGNASFAGSYTLPADEGTFVYDAAKNIKEINPINGQCIVAGSLELKSDLAYTNVAVNASTNITVADKVKGLGYTGKIHVSKAGQETSTANLFAIHKDHLTSLNTPVRYSWDGEKFETIQW